MSRTTITATLVALALACPALGLAQDSSWRLPIGDPARKDRDVPIVLDVITDTRSGASLSATGLTACIDTGSNRAGKAASHCFVHCAWRSKACSRSRSAELVSPAAAA